MKIRLTAFAMMLIASLAFCQDGRRVFTEFHCQAGSSPLYRTEAIVWNDASTLFFELKCQQPREKISAVARLHDRSVFEDDSIEVYIDAACQGKDYMQYIVNPLGTIQDLRFREDDWDSEATTKAEIADNEWTVRLAIPLTELAPFCATSEGDTTIRVNICRTVKGAYYESLLEDGSYSKKEAFIPHTLQGVTEAHLKALYISRLKAMNIDTTALATLKDEEFYAAALEAERKLKTDGKKVLPDGVSIYFDSMTNLIPNPKFEYIDRRGKIANWLKRGVGECSAKDNVLEMTSDDHLEFWQENAPLLDNTRTYALRAKVRSVSGNNCMLVNMTGVDRQYKNKEISVQLLKSPAFSNNDKWEDFEFVFSVPKSAFKGDVGICVEGGTAFIKDMELDYMGKDDSEIIISQLGFHLNGYKDAIIWSRKGGLSQEFELLQGEKTVFRGLARKLPEKNFDRETLIADFSDFRQEGEFRLKTNGLLSHPFKIGKDTYRDAIRHLLKGYYTQRQGFCQEGWKTKADYMDDAYIISFEVKRKEGLLYLPDGRLNPKYILGHRDLTGGWRDAGDDSKQPTDTVSVYALARAQMKLHPDWNSRGTALPELADELWWGCSRLTDKCYMGDGTFIYPDISVTKKSYWFGKAPEDCTDGIPGTDDDRVAFAIPDGNGGYKGELCNQWIFFDTIGITGLALKDLAPETAEKCAKILEAYQINLRKVCETEKLMTKKDLRRSDITMRFGRMAYIAIYLHQLTGRQEFRDEADDMIRHIIGFANTTKYPVAEIQDTQHSYMHYMNAMLEYAEFYPDSALLPDLRAAFSRYLEMAILPGYDMNELFPIFSHKRLAKNRGAKGKESGYAWDATYRVFTLLRAGRVLGRSDFVTLAEKNLQFWMGRNPQNICEVSGMGWRYTATMTGLSFGKGHEDGVVPGLMTNGYRVQSSMPFLSKPVNPVPGGTLYTGYGTETWIVPNGATIDLLAELEGIYAEN